MAEYFITTADTPLFNKERLDRIFGKDRLDVDAKGHMRALEMVAFKGRCFPIERRCGEWIVQVKNPAYPARSRLFLDRRFGKIVPKPSVPKKRGNLCRADVLTSLERAVSTRYVWGGNVRRGIKELLSYYPPPKNLSFREKEQWILRGVDCSGLFYEAMEGEVPRNSRELLFYGNGIDISGLKIGEIVRRLHPLDLIVYRGHVVVVLGGQRAIESCEERGGVVISPLRERIELLYEKGKKAGSDPARAFHFEEEFVARRIGPLIGLSGFQKF